MYECIILDDDDIEEVVMAEEPAPAPQQEKANISAKFEKRLINQVRRHRIIHDKSHKFFGNAAKKDLAWEKIAMKLQTNVDVCKMTWIELCYKYQRFSRRLRNYYLHPKTKKQHRPTMDFEKEIRFLQQFVKESKTCEIPFEIDEPPIIEEENAQVTEPTPLEMNVDDDLILIEQPVELIVIDDDDAKVSDNKYQFSVTPVMKTLANHVKKHPELYDSAHSLFANYTRKSLIWNTIATQMGDKATKLMKTWILMVTRYEWEISRNFKSAAGLPHTDIQKTMEFFQRFILDNPNTVYKNSYYLKNTWYEPIDYFKELYSLISRIKRVPEIVYLTDLLIKKPEKTYQFFNLWNEVAKSRNCSVGICEVTWLIMHNFYWELMKMRNQNYQLTDKWYFESIIKELYDLADDCKQAQQAKKAQQAAVKTYGNNRKTVLNGNLDASPSMPMVVLHNPAVRQAEMVIAPAANSATTQPQSTSPAAPVAQQAQQAQQLRLPVISSAVSLAPPPAVTAAAAAPMKKIVPSKSAVVQLLQNNGLNISKPQLPNSGIEIAKASLAPFNKNPNMLQKPATAVGVTKIALTQNRPKMNTNTPLQSTNTAIPNLTNGEDTKLNTPREAATEAATEAVTQDTTQNESMAPLPKISGAVSLLNPNEILIELIASQNGNHLVVHGPPLSEKYNLPMTVVAKFIREILAIPLLHNKRHNQPLVISSYWEHISKRFNLPTHICRACWNFLLENFTHFPQIAPLRELMKPFTTTLKVWKESTDLFTEFDKQATAKGWLEHITSLPDVVECIGTYPVLYKDVGKNVDNTNTDMEVLCAWRTIALRFPKISDISNIWTAFKNLFVRYMTDIELGIHNKWHINCWRILARLKFLVEVRYTTNEPFYYIVSNKMVEEIERCAMIEMKKRYCKEEPDAIDGLKKPVITDDMILNDRRFSVNMVALLTTIEKYPIIFERGNCMQKYEAWNCVAKELHMDVTDCLLAFRRACQKYCMYKRQDNISRCVLNQRYYKRFDTIFRSIKTSARNNKLNIRTLFELNQSVDDVQECDAATTSMALTPGQASSDEMFFPERYISEIGMSKCESKLVVKNWIYAIGNLPVHCHEELKSKLQTILKKYV